MKKTKRILALIGVILLLSLYIITLISAITSTPATPGLFKACIYSSILIPILLYAYMLIYRVLKGRNEDQSQLPGDKDK